MMLIAPNEQMQKMWQKMFPGVEVILRAKLPACPKHNKLHWIIH